MLSLNYTFTFPPCCGIGGETFKFSRSRPQGNQQSFLNDTEVNWQYCSDKLYAEDEVGWVEVTKPNY